MSERNLATSAPATSGNSTYGPEEVFRVALPVGGGGADDVDVFSLVAPIGAPYQFRVTGVSIEVTTAGAGGSTATLRSAAGGAGNALSGPCSTAAQERAGEATGAIAQSTVNKGAALFVRRTDSTAIGTLFIRHQRVLP